MADALVPQEQFFELIGYLKNMSTRMRSLQDSVSMLERNMEGFGLFVGQKKDSITGSVSELRTDVGEAKDSVRFMQKNTLLVINELKKAVKREDLERIEKRLDLWKPESLVNREEVKRLLEKD